MPRNSFALACATAVLLAALPSMAEGQAPASQPATAPATAAAQVPEALLERMDSQVQRPDPSMTREQAMAALEKSLKAVLEIGQKAEKDYADAANLHEVRQRMLQASQMLGQVTDDEKYAQQARQIARQIVQGQAPPEVKAPTDWYLLRHALTEVGAEANRVEPEIRQFLARYAKTEAAPLSLMYAAVLARQLDEHPLADELLERVRTEHGQVEGAAELLRRFRRPPHVGKPFTAELTRLDGSKLSLPKDLLGKVVVIDFWATWCGPCVAEVPHMKKVYAQYKDKGVEFVGISVDRTRQDVQKFVEQNGMNWVHTYDGPDNPAADRYDVSVFPTIWVVGKDGAVQAVSARGRLAQAIERALAAPTTQPATAPATTKAN